MCQKDNFKALLRVTSHTWYNRLFKHKFMFPDYSFNFMLCLHYNKNVVTGAVWGWK